MKKFVRLGCMIFMALLGGFIGFDPSTPSQTANATQTLIRWVDVPKVDVPFKELAIDLQKEHVSVKGDIDNTTVTINKEEPKPRVITKVVEKEVKIPVYTTDLIWSTRLLNQVAPLEINPILPKRNADRNQSGKAVYKSYKP